jgi:hypothetical protein
VTQSLDSAGAHAINYIVQNEALPEDTQALANISLFVASQMVRGPQTRNMISRMSDTIVKKWGPEVRAGNDIRPVSAYTAADAKFISIKLLRHAPMLAEALLGKVWFLTRSLHEANFTLSDSPVIMHNEVQHPHRGSRGLMKQGIQLYLPLSPRLCLNFFCPTAANKLAYRMGPVFTVPLEAGEPLTIRSENVTFLNSIQFLQCERFLYAQNNEDFDLARDMLKEKPERSRPASEMRTKP